MIPRRQLRLLVLSVAIVTVSTQPVFLLGAAFFDMGPELGVGHVGLGVLTAVFFLASSISSLIMGRWVQAVGWRRAMRVNVIGSGAILILCAVAARSIWTFGGLLLMGSVVYGMSNPAANLSLATQTDPDRAATVFGFKHAGIPGSTLLAGLSVPVIVVHFGWRSAFLVSAAASFAVWFLIPSHEGATGEAFESAPMRGRPLGRSGLAGLALAAALGAVAATALGTYLVSAAVDMGFSEAAAGVVQSVGSAASITMRILMGVLFDRRRVAGFSGLLALMGVGAVTFAVMPLVAGVVFAAVVVVAYTTGWGWPGLMTYTVVDANRASAASSSSVVQAGVFAGAGGGPLVIGLVAEHWGFDAVWLLVAASLVGATLTVAWTRRRAHGPAW